MSRLTRTLRGSAAAQCGEARPHRDASIIKQEATPPRVEARPRRLKSMWPVSVSHRLTAMWGGRAAKGRDRYHRHQKCDGLKLTTSAALQLPTARRSLFIVFLLSAVCLLPTEITPFLTVGLLPSAVSQSETPQSQPTPTPAPSPSPSPTPPPNLHQWGAVTSFHGLPSDRTHAIAQTQYGVTWFATDGGLARYDGR